jgi:hypothetical protein
MEAWIKRERESLLTRIRLSLNSNIKEMVKLKRELSSIIGNPNLIFLLLNIEMI